MKVNVFWDKDLIFMGIIESGYKMVMDGSGDVILFMELVLLLVGVCLSIDVVDILKKGCY